MAVVSEGWLVGEAIASAMSYRTVAPILFEWPGLDDRVPGLMRRVSSSGVRVGLILVDLDSPERLHNVRLLVESGVVRWLVLTDTPPGLRWGLVLEGGCAGVLPMSTSIDALVRAVNDVAAGRPVMSEYLRQRVLEQWRDVAEDQRTLTARMDSLTARETAVLAMLYDGLSVSTIAQRSDVTESTVRSQVKRLRAKLGVDSQLAAVAMYRRALELVPTHRGHRRRAIV